MDKDTAPFGCGCPLVDLDRRPAPGALRRRTRADAGRAAATYQQVSITNENRPLPSRRAGQRPAGKIIDELKKPVSVHREEQKDLSKLRQTASSSYLRRPQIF